MGTPLDPDDLLATARGLGERGDWAALRAWLTSEPGSTGSPEMALLLATAELRLGEPARAVAIVERVIPGFERANNASALRRAANLAGAARFEMGELDGAEHWFARALELANAGEDPLLVARATNNLGLIQNIRGRRQAALAHYQLAIPAYQRVGNTLGLAESYHNMAITYRDERQLAEAEESERRAIEFAREAGSPRLLAMARAGRAELCLLRGDARLAEAGAFLAALEFSAIPDPVGEADALRLLGAAHAALGQTPAALEALDRALALARRHESPLIEAECLLARASVRAAGDPAAAHADALAADSLYARLGAEEERAKVRSVLEEIGE